MAEGIKIGSAFIEINADTAVAQREVDRLRRNVNGSTTTINVNADTLVANVQIATAARSRFVDLNLRVNGLAAVGKSLAALSGAAAAGKMISGIGNSLADIPANLPKIAMVATSIFAIGGAALAASSGVITLAGGLASIAGAGLALPGIMAGFAVGAGVMIAALKDAPTVLADLGPAFSGLQDSISSNFWNQAAAPIRNMVNGLLPQLSSGLNTVATDLGGFFGQFASALQGALGGGVLDGMMGNLSSSIQIAGGAITPLVGAFTTLGTIGATYLPQLATWFVTISEKFGSFISGAAADGSLKGWIDGGIAGLQTLGSIVGSVAGIFHGLYTAATAAGGSGLTGLADGLAKISTIVNGPAFQGALTTVFQGAAAGMAGLSSALGPIGDMFVKLAPTISNVITIAGQLAGQVLGGLAAAISQPAFATGLTHFFEGIQMGVQAILPHLPVLGTMFGTLMSVVGQLAAVVGPVLGAAIGALAPAFTTILTAIQPLIPILGGALITIITGLTPIITMLASVFAQLMPPIMALVAPLTQIVMALIPPLMTIFQALIPIVMQVVTAIAPLVTMIASALTPAINMLMPVVLTVFSAISAIITSVMQIVQGVIEVATGLITGNWDMVWQGIQNVFSGVWNTIVSLVEGAIAIVGSVISAGVNLASQIISTVFNGIVSFLGGVWNNITSAISGAFNTAVNFVTNGVNNIKNFIQTGFNNAVQFVRDAFTNISTAVSDGITKAVDFVKGLPGKIKDGIGNLSSTLSNAGGQIIEGFLSGLKAGFETVKNFVGGIGDWIAKNKGPKAYDLALLIPNGGWIMKGLKKGIENGIPDLNKTLSNVAKTASKGIGDMSANVMVGTQSSIPHEVGRGINRAGVVQSSGSSSTVSNFYVTIDAKSVEELQNMKNFFDNIQQTARTGRGTQNARVA